MPLKRLLSNPLLALLASIAMLLAGLAGPAAAAIVVKDIAGREVTLPQPAKRVVLSQARYLPVLGLIHPDPVSILAGWSDEFKASYANEYQAYRKKFPAIENIPIVGKHRPDTFSVEKTIALRPDLVILTAMFAGLQPGADPRASPLIRHFEEAGIPVIVVDFFVKPLENTEPSLRALGQALGREEQAEAFIAFYRQHMDGIAARTANMAPSSRPPVLVHAHAGITDCCNSPGLGTFNDMIQLAGGHNIGQDVLKRATGQLGFEYVNRRNPAVYVATGTGAARGSGDGLKIGMGASEEQARASLRSIVSSPALSSLAAVRSGNAHGIWHGFNDSPLHVVFIEALARWLHPERFADVSAQATLDEINRRFAAIPYEGSFLIDLQPQANVEKPRNDAMPSTPATTSKPRHETSQAETPPALRAAALPAEIIDDPRITRLDIPAPQGGQPWRIQVARPACEAPAQGYPALYLLDGDATFPTAWRALASLGNPCLALVGIGYPGGARIDVARRYYDLTPPTAAEYLRGRNPDLRTGGRDAFLDFVTGPLRARLAQMLPMDATRQTLFGHSLGGLFVLHALMARPEQFQSYVAADPSLWWNGNSALNEADAFLGGIAAAGGALAQPIRLRILTSGSQPPRVQERRPTPAEQAAPGDQARQLAREFARIRGFDVHAQHYPNETHGTLLPLSAEAATRFASGLMVEDGEAAHASPGSAKR